MPRTVVALHSAVFAKLPRPQARIMHAVARMHPGHLTREEIGKQVDMAPTGGAFQNYLGALRTLGLLTYPSKGTVRAADILFPKGLR